jgi:hypothetical protein
VNDERRGGLLWVADVTLRQSHPADEDVAFDVIRTRNQRFVQDVDPLVAHGHAVRDAGQLRILWLDRMND